MQDGDERRGDLSGGRARRKVIVLVVLLLAFLIVLLIGVVVGVRSGRSRSSGGRGAAADSAMMSHHAVGSMTALSSLDSGLVGDSIRDRIPDTSVSTEFSRSRRGTRPQSARADTAVSVQSADNAVTLPGTTVPDTAGADDAVGEVGACRRDTVAPWVYPDPSGGLHRRAVNVALLADKPCRIEWRWSGETVWRHYRGEWIVIDRSATIQYRGTDTCGNAMEPQEEHYEIQRSGDTTRCPPDMEFITVAGTAFCIDRYEWPNRRNQRPSSYVSFYHAMDSCFSVGKRLCTSDEWKLACSGPYGWAYPYGELFEERACVTQDSGRAPSGSKPECRGYFDVYDMSGNLAEWTNTRSSANNRFFNVMGGFWESGSQSGCFDARYSYFPQNRHNPVGFRCCADATAANEPGARGRSGR